MTDTQSKEINIHYTTDNLIIGNIKGAKNPVAIIEDEMLDDLIVRLIDAKKEAIEQKTEIKVEKLLLLIEVLSKILRPYTQVRNKLYDGYGQKREFSVLAQEVDELFEELKKFQG